MVDYIIGFITGAIACFGVLAGIGMYLQSRIEGVK